jgi:hypothetical protein
VTDNINALDGGTGSAPRSVATSSLTDDTRPTIVGTGLQGTTVDIYDTFNNGTSTVTVRLGSATVSSSGTWSFTPVNANWTVSAGTATGRFYAGSHTLKAIATFGATTQSTDPGSSLYNIRVAGIVQTTVTAGVVTGGGTFTFGLFDFNGDGVFDAAGGWARANAVDAAYNNLTLPSQTQLGTANLTSDATDNLWTRTSATGGHRYQVSPGVFASAPDTTTNLRAAYILN